MFCYLYPTDYTCPSDFRDFPYSGNAAQSIDDLKGVSNPNSVCKSKPPGKTRNRFESNQTYSEKSMSYYKFLHILISFCVQLIASGVNGQQETALKNVEEESRLTLVIKSRSIFSVEKNVKEKKLLRKNATRSLVLVKKNYLPQ